MLFRLGGVAACAALFALSGCGGCGDDTAVEPDAEIVDPDAEVPDAAPSVVGPVTGFDASPGASAGSVDTTWTNPTGLSEVIVVRHLGAPVTSAPANGTTYAVDDTTGTGDVVVYVGTGESFSESGLVPGLVYYAAFARNEVATWATPAATDNALVAAAAQTATITVTVSTTTAVVTAQPPNYTLAATATYDGGLDQLTVHVDATSGFARNVFAPKAEVTAVNQGAIAGDGILDTFPYMRLGYAIAPAATAGADFLFTGVDGTVDTITIDLTLVDNPAAIVFADWGGDFAYEWVDTVALGSISTVDCDALIFANNTEGNCPYTPGALSADATKLYAGNRGLPVVREIDVATGAVLRSLSLDAGLGSVFRVAMSPDGTTLYAVLHLGGHVYPGGGDATGAIPDISLATVDGAVVKIDVATLTETSRLLILDDVPYENVRLGTLAISPTGAQLAITLRSPVAASLYLVDANAMTLSQTVDLGTVLTGFEARRVVYDSTGTNMYVRTKFAEVAKVDVGTSAVTGVTIDGGDVDSNGGDMIAGPDGVVYLTYREDGAAGAPSSLARIDGTTVTYAAGTGYGALGLLGDRLFLGTYADLKVYDATALTAEPTNGGALVMDPSHGLTFTPF